MRFEYYMKRAVVNCEEIEDERTRIELFQVVNHLKENDIENAIKCMPTMHFEWLWGNGDGNANSYFSNINDFSFNLTHQNSYFQIGEINEHLVITASVNFELSLKRPIKSNKIQEWLDTNNMVHCGYISGGWSYKQDDGIILTVV